MRNLSHRRNILSTIILASVITVLTGCADEPDATQSLLSKGYKQVVVRRTTLSFGCLKFMAVDPVSQKMDGVICKTPTGYYIKESHILKEEP